MANRFLVPAIIGSISGVGLDVIGNTLQNAYPDTPHWVWLSLFWAALILFLSLPTWAIWQFIKFLRYDLLSLWGSWRRFLAHEQSAASVEQPKTGPALKWLSIPEAINRFCDSETVKRRDKYIEMRANSFTKCTDLDAEMLRLAHGGWNDRPEALAKFREIQAQRERIGTVFGVAEKGLTSETEALWQELFESLEAGDLIARGFAKPHRPGNPEITIMPPEWRVLFLDPRNETAVERGDRSTVVYTGIQIARSPDFKKTEFPPTTVQRPETAMISLKTGATADIQDSQLPNDLRFHLFKGETGGALQMKGVKFVREPAPEKSTGGNSLWPSPAVVHPREILLSNSWMLNFNPASTTGKKEISFVQDGRIGDGANSNEYRWEFIDEILRITRATGELQNDFKFDAEHNQFVCTNNSFAKGMQGQTIFRINSASNSSKHVGFQEAAQVGYERAERERWLDLVVGDSSDPEDRLTSFKYMMLIEATKGLVALNGVRRPSRQSMPIPKEQLEDLHPGKGENTLRSITPNKIVFEDVTINEADLEKVIEIYRTHAETDRHGR